MSNRVRTQLANFNKIVRATDIEQLPNGTYTVLRIIVDCVLETRQEETGACVTVRLPRRYRDAIKINHIVCMWIVVVDYCVTWMGTHPSKVADLNNIQVCVDVNLLADGLYQFTRLGNLYGFVGGNKPIYVSFPPELLENIPREFTLCVENGVVRAAEPGAYFAAVAVSSSETIHY
jgi:hypothetical protein